MNKVFSVLVSDKFSVKSPIFLQTPSADKMEKKKRKKEKDKKRKHKKQKKEKRNKRSKRDVDEDDDDNNDDKINGNEKRIRKVFSDINEFHLFKFRLLRF